MNGIPDADGGGAAGRRGARLYVGALATEAVVIALLWLLGRYFGA